MSTEKIYNGVLNVVKKRMQGKTAFNHLDIGAGTGELIKKLQHNFNISSQACDYHVERFELSDVPVLKIDLNKEHLPYEDNSFDLITCSEVIEHLENHRQVLREMSRILKRDGLLILTTPNVLNVKSRLRYMVSGFANLFGPLPIKHDEVYSTGGHINPLPFFYLGHSLADADFVGIKLDIDKIQRTSLVLLVMFSPLILLGWKRFLFKEKKRVKTLSSLNTPLVKMHSSFEVLTARTIIVSAVNNKSC